MKGIKLVLTTYILALRVNSALVIELTFFESACSSFHLQILLLLHFNPSFCTRICTFSLSLSLSFSFDMLICRFLREERRRKKKTKREFIVNKVCCGGADS
jgi:hypothetical protein